MSLDIIPADIHERYEVDERRHSCAILAADYPEEFSELIDCLRHFELVRSEVIAEGGGKSKIASRFDDYLKVRGWAEKSTRIGMTVDDASRNMETHAVDLCKTRVATEVQWNNKDPFFSRDLNTFRLLHGLGVISVGVIITRSDELQDLFVELGWIFDEKRHKWKRVSTKFGASTTHWSKLMNRVESDGGGMCPLLLFGIRRACYRDDIPKQPIISEQPDDPP